MSFEVCLFSDDNGKLLPLANDHERFVLERTNIAFQIKTSGGVFKSKGRIYLTTERIVFVADKSSMQNGLNFEAFDVPLAGMLGTKFNQPIFGCCSISGFVFSNCDQNDSHEQYEWKLLFINGGTGKFLPVFLQMLEKKRNDKELDLEFLTKQQKAFVDPNDPTVIYLSQPVVPDGNGERNVC